MSQYLDSAGLQTLVTKTKEYARKSAKDAVNASAAAASKTITGWNDDTSAAIYGDIGIAESQVTGLVNDLAAKAPLVSPAFSGTPTVPYPQDTTTASSAIANVKYVLDTVGNIGQAMHYKGTVDGTHPLPTSGVAGDTWKVATSGTYAGYVCEVGDMIIANKAFDQTPTSSDVDVIQTNIDGAVTGPQSSTNGNFVLFDGETGKVIKNSNVNPDSFKTKQNVYSSSSGTLATLTDITQNENGEIAVTFQDIQTASTSQKGVVQLSNASASTAEDVAATPKAVKDAYDVLNSLKQDNLAFEGTYNADTNKVATQSTVSDAIAALDATVTSTGGTNVQIQVEEADGVITAVNVTTDNTVNVAGVSGIVEGYINSLDAPVSAIAPSATITSIAETDGKIAITSGAIEITTSQITDFQAVLDDKANKAVPAAANNIALLNASGNLVDGGFGLNHFKTVQDTVDDPTAAGTAESFIDTISQDANGEITVTKKTVQNASESLNGLMSSVDYTKLHNMSVSSVNVTNAGVLEIDGTSAMRPISTDAIIDLFS